MRLSLPLPLCGNEQDGLRSVCSVNVSVSGVMSTHERDGARLLSLAVCGNSENKRDNESYDKIKLFYLLQLDRSGLKNNGLRKKKNLSKLKSELYEAKHHEKPLKIEYFIYVWPFVLTTEVF